MTKTTQDGGETLRPGETWHDVRVREQGAFEAYLSTKNTNWQRASSEEWARRWRENLPEPQDREWARPPFAALIGVDPSPPLTPRGPHPGLTWHGVRKAEQAAFEAHLATLSVYDQQSARRVRGIRERDNLPEPEGREWMAWDEEWLTEEDAEPAVIEPPSVIAPVPIEAPAVIAPVPIEAPAVIEEEIVESEVEPPAVDPNAPAAATVPVQDVKPKPTREELQAQLAEKRAALAAAEALAAPVVAEPSDEPPDVAEEPSDEPVPAAEEPRPAAEEPRPKTTTYSDPKRSHARGGTVEPKGKNRETEKLERVARLYDVEAERAALGAILVNGEVSPAIRDLLTPDDFGPGHSAIFWEMLRLQERSQPVEFVALMDGLQGAGGLDAIGGAAYLSELLSACRESAHGLHYARLVKDKAIKRGILAALESGAKLIDRAKDPAAALAEIQAGLAGLGALVIEKRRTGWSHSELMATDFPEPRCIVDGLIPEGLTVIAGSAKIGKSWLALQMAQAVASGADFLGRKTIAGPVLYLALEDGPIRLKSRLLKQRADMGPSDLPISYQTEWPKLEQGGLIALQAAIEEAIPALVILDTFTRARDLSVQENAPEVAQAAETLQVMAREGGLALVVIHHHNKAASVGVRDALLNLRGSSAIGATADTILGLYRERGEREATLQTVSRDLDDSEIRLEFDSVDTFSWQYLGDEKAIVQTDAQEEALEAVRMLGEATAGDVAKELGKTRPAVRKTLNDLCASGALVYHKEQGRRGGSPAVVYSLPTEGGLKQGTLVERE